MHRIRRWAPWVAAFGLALNAVLLWGLWQRAAYDNHYLWGNTTMHLIAGLTWLDSGRDPEGLVALEVLGSMRSLPRYSRRFEPGDHQAIERFVREAAQVRSQMAAELREGGEVSAETRESAEPVDEGLRLMIERLHQAQELEGESFALNDAAWRRMWQEIALEIGRVGRN